MLARRALCGRVGLAMASGCARPGPIEAPKSAMAPRHGQLCAHARAIIARHVSAQSQSGGRGLTQMQLNVEREGLWITLSRNL
jgi:hypothetical protein